MIRFFRIGKKNQPSFKIVVTDKKNPPRGGRFVEEVGFYNPLTKEKILRKERIEYWLSQGVRPSETVHNLLVEEGILKEAKIPLYKKSPEKEEKLEKLTEGGQVFRLEKTEEKTAEEKVEEKAGEEAENKFEEKSEEKKDQ